jgi:hypothetical protein
MQFIGLNKQWKTESSPQADFSAFVGCSFCFEPNQLY